MAACSCRDNKHSVCGKKSKMFFRKMLWATVPKDKVNVSQRTLCHQITWRYTAKHNRAKNIQSLMSKFDMECCWFNHLAFIEPHFKVNANVLVISVARFSLFTSVLFIYCQITRNVISRHFKETNIQSNLL